MLLCFIYFDRAEIKDSTTTTTSDGQVVLEDNLNKFCNFFANSNKEV